MLLESSQLLVVRIVRCPVTSSDIVGSHIIWFGFSLCRFTLVNLKQENRLTYKDDKFSSGLTFSGNLVNVCFFSKFYSYICYFLLITECLGFSKTLGDASGGYIDASSTTMMSCWSTCLNEPRCTAFDWNPTAPSCELLTSKDANTTMPSGTVHHFFLSCSC